jgi:putative ABC transport system substrate-binding protein
VISFTSQPVEHAALGAHTAFGQKRVPKIGFLWHAENAEQEAPYFGAFRQGLSTMGYVDGTNIEIIDTFAGEKLERYEQNVHTLTNIPVDIIVANSRPATLAAQKINKDIPIIFILIPDPVGTKLVQSLARPGGNITGLTHVSSELAGKRLELIKEAAGHSRIALLANTNDPANVQLFSGLYRAAASNLEIALEVIEAAKPADLPGAFEAIAQKGIRAANTINDPMYWNERDTIAKLAIDKNIAVMGHTAEMTRAGMLLSYAPNYPLMFQRIAFYVDKILKGEKPAEIPVEQPTKFELVINLKTARRLGITVPKILLTAADEVIE